MNNLLFIIPVIISAIVVLALINEESSLTSTVSTKAKAKEYDCEPKSLNEVKLSFPVKEPTYIPEGYKLEVVDPYTYSAVENSEDSDVVDLYYSKEPLCRAVPLGYGDVIFIRVADTQNPLRDGDKRLKEIDKDPLAYFTKRAEEWNMFIPNAAELIDKPESTIPVVRVVNVNDYIGIAREPSKGYSVYIFHDEDGKIKDKVVEELDDINPGFVGFYHAKDKTVYSIWAKLPVKEMLKIAESIP